MYANLLIRWDVFYVQSLPSMICDGDKDGDKEGSR
jgi:hypothetical protein